MNDPKAKRRVVARKRCTKNMKLKNQRRRRLLKRHVTQKKWICAASNFALIPPRSIRQMLPISSGDKFWKTASKIRKRKTNSLSCVHFFTFPTKGIFAWAFSRRRSRAATAKKCTKKRDARAESLFCRFRCLSYLLGTLRSNDADGKKNVKKKTNTFYKQNNNFARASRFSVHFFACFCTTTTEKCLI